MMMITILSFWQKIRTLSLSSRAARLMCQLVKQCQKTSIPHAIWRGSMQQFLSLEMLTRLWICSKGMYIQVTLDKFSWDRDDKPTDFLGPVFWDKPSTQHDLRSSWLFHAGLWTSTGKEHQQNGDLTWSNKHREWKTPKWWKVATFVVCIEVLLPFVWLTN